MSNIAAKHHHGGRRARSQEIPTPVDLYHVPVSVDHYRILPKKESREVFDSDGRLVEAYDVKKKIQEGELRLERHTGAAIQAGSVRAPPKKGGRGGKYTWEGQYTVVEQEEAPAALDSRDPNYDEFAPEPVLHKRKAKKKGERGTIAPPWESDQEGVVKEEKVGLGGKTQGREPAELGGGHQQLNEAKEMAERIGPGPNILSEEQLRTMVHGVDISEFLAQAVDQMEHGAGQYGQQDQQKRATEAKGDEQAPGEVVDISEVMMPEPGKYVRH